MGFCISSKMFQFLIGRLKTLPIITASLKLYVFQFLIGRLKTNCWVSTSALIILVSIPYR